MKSYFQKWLPFLGHGIALISFCGCSLLIPPAPVSKEEAEIVIREAAGSVVGVPDRCAHFSANVYVQMEAPFSSGIMEGYVRTMAPGFLKYVGITPMGMPLFVLSTNGDHFLFLHVTEKKAYEGALKRTEYAAHLPDGFNTMDLFYWLTGRVAPDAGPVVDVSRENDLYRLTVMGKKGERQHIVYYDPLERVVVRQVLEDGEGLKLFEITYDGHEEGSTCPQPMKVTVSYVREAQWIRIHLSEIEYMEEGNGWNDDTAIPSTFEKVIVQ